MSSHSERFWFGSYMIYTIHVYTFKCMYVICLHVIQGWVLIRVPLHAKKALCVLNHLPCQKKHSNFLISISRCGIEGESGVQRAMRLKSCHQSNIKKMESDILLQCKCVVLVSASTEKIYFLGKSIILSNLHIYLYRLFQIMNIFICIVIYDL